MVDSILAQVAVNSCEEGENDTTLALMFNFKHLIPDDFIDIK